VKHLAFFFGVLLSVAAQAQQVPNPVSGPPSSVMNELTSWNSVYGNALKHGPAFITNDMPTTVDVDGSPLTGRNTTAFTAGQILDGAFLIPPGSGGKAYDGLRGVAFAPAATTINLVNGVAGYVVSDAVTATGGFPASVVLFGAGVARGTGAKVWGLNTLLSDTLTGAVSAGTGKSLNNELDFNVSSPSTTILGLQFAGGSKAQPAYAHAVILQPIDGVNNGSVAKWTDFLSSTGGSTWTFADIGTKERTGTSVHSQDVVFNFLGSTGVAGKIGLAGSESGGLEILSSVAGATKISLLGGAGAAISVPDQGGFIINSRVAMLGNGATFSLGGDPAWTTQNLGNASTAALNLYGTNIVMNGVITTTSNVLGAAIGALLNGAGPNAGTLSNSPKAGNPTKWVPFNDNGTLRYIPMW